MDEPTGAAGSITTGAAETSPASGVADMLHAVIENPAIVAVPITNNRLSFLSVITEVLYFIDYESQ